MKYYIDTEFYERGHKFPIQLISIGIVSEDNQEYYAEIDDIDVNTTSDWLKQNVAPSLSGIKKSREVIAKEILKFMGQDDCKNCTAWGIKQKAHLNCNTCGNTGKVFNVTPEFWGYFSDYDWVLFCQIFGNMIELPYGMPMFCNDTKQLANSLKINKSSFPIHEGTMHNALDDAKWTKKLHEALMEKIPWYQDV